MGSLSLLQDILTSSKKMALLLLFARQFLQQKSGGASLPGMTLIFVVVQSLSRVQLFGTPWTVAHRTPLSMGFLRQEYWSRLSFPSPGDLPEPGIKPASLVSPALAGRFLTAVPPGELAESLCKCD